MLSPCSHPGCRLLSRDRYCSKHRAVAEARARRGDSRRGSSSSRGYDSRWRNQIRPQVLAEEPVCQDCGLHASTVVDHIIPRREMERQGRDPDVRSNLQGLCAGCHSRKTAREDGGFGNPAKGSK